MDYRKLNNDITGVVAKGLHYLENLEATQKMVTCEEVIRATDGGIERYRNDPIYHAKVQMLVAHLLEVIRSNDVPN